LNTQQPIAIFWFRRDLRLEDNAALYHALQSGYAVLPVFIFDTQILDALVNKHDKRVAFIHLALQQLHAGLQLTGSGLQVMHGTPIACFKTLLQTYTIKAVYTNEDYEPYALQRDQHIADVLQTNGIAFYSYKDQLIFAKDEILKDNGTPYTVFTPYSRRWKEKLKSTTIEDFQIEKHKASFYKYKPQPLPTLKDIGFNDCNLTWQAPALQNDIAINYNTTRDYPAIPGTTRLSVHLRFGTISIRKLVKQVMVLNEVLLNELIWREFYQMILWHFPQVINTSFKKEYDAILWRNKPEEFKHWRNGTTGYPIVDAGMRELNATGFMHNRVRMITASFLTKHLLIDWRKGEAYFAEKLMDYDLAANNGGWQWAAGCGCDAAPYFRIFNPYLQTEKFDKALQYINKWVPELNSLQYPAPIVAHTLARERCLKAYKLALNR